MATKAHQWAVSIQPFHLCAPIIVVMSAVSTTSYYPFDSMAPAVFELVQKNNYLQSKSFLPVSRKF
jgi:hypothetical protein